MDPAAEGDAAVPSRGHPFDDTSPETSERLLTLQAQQDAFDARVLQVESSLRERESALALRERAAEQSEENARSGHSTTSAIEAHNLELREANAKLVVEVSEPC